MTVFRPNRVMEKLDHEKEATITFNSPSKLIVGGRARLVRLAISHHIHMSGRAVCKPRASIMVRL